MDTSRNDEAKPDQDSDDGGQVSEVSGLQEAGTVSPGDSVAGQPAGESGETDEGPTGPDAPTFAEERDHQPDKDDVETTG